MKKIILLLLLIKNCFLFGDTFWSGEDKQGITVVFKVLDPLIVNVEKPSKLYISKLDKKFSYSEKSDTKKSLLVSVETPYENVDNILRRIYENVYFKLENNGVFKLSHESQKQFYIQGNGYFIDDQYISKDLKATEYSKPFSNTLNGNKFYTTTNIDVDFSILDENIPLGIYNGSLILNVWFGGSIR